MDPRFWNACSYHDIINALYAKNLEVWEYVFLEWITPVLHYSKCKNRMDRYMISYGDIYCALWSSWTSTNYDWSDFYDSGKEKWVYKQVWRIIDRLCKKEMRRKMRETSIPPILIHFEKKTDFESSKKIDKCLRLLWKRSPKESYILMLLNQCRYSHGEVSKILNITVEDSRKAFERAKNHLREIFHDYSVNLVEF